MSDAPQPCTQCDGNGVCTACEGHGGRCECKAGACNHCGGCGREPLNEEQQKQFADLLEKSDSFLDQPIFKDMAKVMDGDGPITLKNPRSGMKEWRKLNAEASAAMEKQIAEAVAEAVSKDIDRVMVTPCTSCGITGFGHLDPVDPVVRATCKGYEPEGGWK